MATNDLRQRVVTQQTLYNNNNTETMVSTERETFLPQHGSGLSAKSMIDSCPQQHGVVLKLHVPLLYSILPEFLQRIILSISFLSFLGPTWKQRYLIVCGSYLYKFKDQVSEVPKGSPFELETIRVSSIPSESIRIPELGNIPPGFLAVFTISTFRRLQYYAVSDEEEAKLWIRSINDARHETITRKMGHSGSMPYPSTWRYFDSLGQGLLKSKERIRVKMEEYNMRELETSTFVTGGPVMRGMQ